MAKLTEEQANNLWNDRFESVKLSCNGDFHCFNFASKLDGENYYLHYDCEDGVITDTTTNKEIEAQVKADLLNVDYKGALMTISSETI